MLYFNHEDKLTGFWIVCLILNLAFWQLCLICGPGWACNLHAYLRQWAISNNQHLDSIWTIRNCNV